MTTSIIITICILIIVAYLFDLTAPKTKIPSVILLLILGWGGKNLAIFFGIDIPDLSPVLPVFGTLGLILIVLEGSLELEINKSKIPLIKKTFFVSLLPMVIFSFLLAYIFYTQGNEKFVNCLINAIPFGIISSAIAIPSVSFLSQSKKEFVIYESSLSDILGVIIFYFIVLNETINLKAFGNFGLELLIIGGVSFLATVVLSYLLSRIDHHIKFAPIVVLIILIYSISKVFHLPGLIFILLFGVFINNLDELKKFKWIEKLKPDILDKEVEKFKEIVIEGTFLIRSLFFILFGFLIETSEILNLESFIWSFIICCTIFIIRGIFLKISKVKLSPLLFIAPRGLITVLLFLEITPEQSIHIVSKPLVIQVIILSTVFMMFGLMFLKRKNI